MTLSARRAGQSGPWLVSGLALLWLVAYWFPWANARGTWIALAGWCAAHGFGDLQRSTLFVTVVVTICALLGAGLRLQARRTAREGARGGLRWGGLALSGAPLAVLLPYPGAVLFLAGLGVAAFTGWAMDRDARDGVERRPEPLWRTLGSESFAVLSAGCFVALSWQYNAQLLTRGVMIAAGCALLVRAALTGREAAGTGERIRNEG